MGWGDRNRGASHYDAQYLSRNGTYYCRAYQIDGYVETRDGRKTVKGIHWIAKPLGDDSLVCYSMGDRRGYINMLTGEQAIAPQYRHAWVFSDCLASVDDDGWIKFVDATNQWHSSTRERATMPKNGPRCPAAGSL